MVSFAFLRDYRQKRSTSYLRVINVKKFRYFSGLVFLFSAHILYGKGKYLNQTGFVLQKLPRIIVYVI